MTDFTVKDSGVRESFDSGMVRDTEDGKIDYSLVLDGPMFKRWAAHLTKGAQKYSPRNWMQANGSDEFERFKRSFLRHAIAYLDGERDEDHAAAMVFNINGMEYVREQVVTGGFVSAEYEHWCGAKNPDDPDFVCERLVGHTGDHWLPQCPDYEIPPGVFNQWAQ